MAKKKFEETAKRNKQGLATTSSARVSWRRRWGIWLWAAVVVLGIAAVAGALHLASAHSVPPQRLVGRWLRPDGGYVLEIRAAGAGGQLEAAYFNPRPIHVAQANYKRDGREVTVFVELQDVNYPGSTYSLRYVAGEDRLVGEYFQALQRQTFDVEFVRSKETTNQGQ